MKASHLEPRRPHGVRFAWARVPVLPGGRLLADEGPAAVPRIAYRLFDRAADGVGCMVQHWFPVDAPRGGIARVLVKLRRELRQAVAAMNSAKRPL